MTILAMTILGRSWIAAPKAARNDGLLDKAGGARAVSQFECLRVVGMLHRRKT